METETPGVTIGRPIIPGARPKRCWASWSCCRCIAAIERWRTTSAWRAASFAAFCATFAAAFSSRCTLRSTSFTRRPTQPPTSLRIWRSAISRARASAARTMYTRRSSAIASRSTCLRTFWRTDHTSSCCRCASCCARRFSASASSWRRRSSGVGIRCGGIGSRTRPPGATLGGTMKRRLFPMYGICIACPGVADAGMRTSTCSCFGFSSRTQLSPPPFAAAPPPPRCTPWPGAGRCWRLARVSTRWQRPSSTERTSFSVFLSARST